jgi:hypothetical protein
MGTQLGMRVCNHTQSNTKSFQNVGTHFVFIQSSCPLYRTNNKAGK